MSSSVLIRYSLPECLNTILADLLLQRVTSKPSSLNTDNCSCNSSLLRIFRGARVRVVVSPAARRASRPLQSAKPFL